MKCGRSVSEREINDAVRHSQRCVENSAREPRTGPRWPERNDAAIEAIVRSGPTLAALEKSSPKRFSTSAPQTEAIVDLLFPGNPLLCIGRTLDQAATAQRELLRGSLASCQFIVPNPMSANKGSTKDGKQSARCLSNTGPRRFLVVEFDQGTFDQHAAILAHLRQYSPLVLGVHSGKKSLHGWFFCLGQSEERVEKFFKYAVSLGADPATWTRCQFVRMPDGRRDNGKLQRVVFFNPKPMETNA